MGWRGILVSLLCSITLVESSSNSRKMWSLNIVSESSPLYSWAVYSAGFFVLVAVVLSMYLIVEHLAAYKQPEEQKFLIGLILMVPVYAVESFLSLMDSNAAFNYEIIRDCYEAFALYCFERYLIACLGGEKNTIEFMESQSVVSSSLPLLDDAYAYGVVEHPFPLNCFIREWYLGSDFYQAVKIGIVQYMILKMICALLAVIFHLFGIYGEGKFEWRYAYSYLAVVLNFSQTWALYCLVQFYSVTKNKLAPIKPLAKFLVFKSIVFLTWWQGIAVAFLLSFGTFKGSLAQLLKTRIQDYIICIESKVFSDLWQWEITTLRCRNCARRSTVSKHSMEGVTSSVTEIRQYVDASVAQAMDKFRRLLATSTNTHGGVRPLAEGIPRGENRPGNYQLPTRNYQIDFPKFDGQGLREWLYRCEQFFDLDETPEDSKVKLTSCNFEGKALQWHQSYMKHRLSREWPRWTEYVGSLYARFGAELFDDPMGDFKDLRQVNSVQDYVGLFDELLTRVELSED